MIELAKSAGFCFGVKRATDCIEELLEKNGRAKIYTLGKLIHNRIYLDELYRRGVSSIDESEAEKIAASASEESPVILVIRAHGITKECERHLGELSEKYPYFSVIDMTCPFVKRIHKIAAENTGKDTRFILLGNAEHPEVLGIMSYAKGECAVFPTADEIFAYIEGCLEEKPTVFTSQTTQSTFEWKKTQKNLKKLCTNAKIFDTICNVTENRQSEAEEIARRSDAMIVIGGKDSSNTRKLYEAAKRHCPDTHWIESADQLCVTSLTGKRKIGITAGASTPAKLIMEVQSTMNTENFDFEAMLEESLRTIHTGETVTGYVDAIEKNAIYVNLGTKVTGVVAREKITDDMSIDLNQLVKVGDQVEAFVVRVNDREGTAQLDMRRVQNDKAWKAMVALKESGEVVDATITAAIKGGVLADVNGYKVFMPASQISTERVEDLSSVVGQVKKVVVIDIDNAKKRAVCSAKVIEKAEKKALADKVWETLEVDQRFRGTVKNLIQVGAFVDIGGVDGLIPNSELSWRRIKHPSQVVKVGQEVEVYIKELDRENRKITLGYRTEEMDPFFAFKNTYKVGDDVEAKIVSIMPFGAFAEVMDGADGLIHISKISREKVAKPEDVLSIGQVVKARITEIDEENRKFNLSMRVYEDEEYNAKRAEERAAAKAEREAQRQAEIEEKAKEEAEYAPYIVRTID